MFDLVSVVGHINDTTLDGSDDSNDNLVAHIRVGPSYHQRKEVCTFCIITYSSRAIALTLGSQTIADWTGYLHICGTFCNYVKLYSQFHAHWTMVCTNTKFSNRTYTTIGYCTT